jgi:hypothetical protein
VFRDQREFFTPKEKDEGSSNPFAFLLSGSKEDATQEPLPRRLANAINRRLESKAKQAIENLLSSEEWPAESLNGNGLKIQFQLRRKWSVNMMDMLYLTTTADNRRYIRS